LAAGEFTLRTKSPDHVLHRPEFIGPNCALPAYSPLSRRMIRKRDVQHFVWGHRALQH
jgi:hypothetical protein